MYKIYLGAKSQSTFKFMYIKICMQFPMQQCTKIRRYFIGSWSCVDKSTFLLSAFPIPTLLFFGSLEIFCCCYSRIFMETKVYCFILKLRGEQNSKVRRKHETNERIPSSQPNVKQSKQVNFQIKHRSINVNRSHEVIGIITLNTFE